MQKLFAVLYTALALGANPGWADVSGLLTGDMAKLVLSEPAPLPQAALIDMEDAPRSLEEFRGKWVVLNFWATWCPPCREEMPALDRLQAAMPEIAVVPVATGRNDPAAMQRLFDEAGIQQLEILRDPKSQLGRALGVMGLPVTLIVNPEGQEVGRLLGDAHWDGAEAQAVVQALMAGG
ncbi:MAG: TlpA family protein disulfide reductase [Rhodobacteraceae bacterium]|nr:TlpA family protein disulfide reductase [Paracoccaceae bacterium]